MAGEDCYMLKVAAHQHREPRGRAPADQGAGHPVSTKTTIVLSSVFEKAGIAPVEDD